MQLLHMKFANKFLTYIKWQIDRPIDLKGKKSVHLDLGSGSRPANPFNCDYLIASDVKINTYKVQDNFKFISLVNFSIPIDNSSIDSVSAYDVIEHIPRNFFEPGNQMFNPFIQMMNEIARILKPGGIFIAVTPAYPSSVAFQDPTHVNFITIDTVNYFTNCEWATDLGYEFAGKFEIIQNCWLRGQSPYVGRLDVGESTINGYPISKSGLNYYLRIMKRFFKFCIFPQKKTHILWVLKKTI